LGEAAEEPADPEAVCPEGDADLVAGEKGDGGADAVDGGKRAEVALEVEAEALLGAAAEGDDDVCGAALAEGAEEGLVNYIPCDAVREIAGDRCRGGASGRGGGGSFVEGGEVDVFGGYVDALRAEPGEVGGGAGGAGHDPEGAAGEAEIGEGKEREEVFEAGEAANVVALEEVPEEDHEGAVG